MRIVVSRLKEGDNPLSFSTLRDEWIKIVVAKLRQQGYPVQGDLEVNLNLTKIEPDYYMRGKLQFTVEQPCARCAEAFPLAVDQSFHLALAHVQKVPIHPTSLSEESDELDVTYFDGNEIELVPIVQEQFVLSIPYQPLCSPTCRGLCQKCGKNLNRSTCQCDLTEKISSFSILKEMNANPSKI
jgi:uncharacterized protein